MDLEQLIIGLASEIKIAISPLLGSASSRQLTGKGFGGDETFSIDEVAEDEARDFLKKTCKSIAYFSEDKGLVRIGESPKIVLVLDPIDGTRPAAAGLESCCVSIAAAPIDSPKMKDVICSVVLELKSDRLFFAQRGEGTRIESDSEPEAIRVSSNSDIESLFWTIGFRGRPAEILSTTLSRLIDSTSVKGGVFDIGSASFSMTRLLTGQLDAYVDIGTRIIDEIPETENEFRRVGSGSILNNSPYDVAGSILLLQEADIPVTDARGNSLDEMPLLGCGKEFQVSVVAANNRQIHKELISIIDAGIERLRSKLPRLLEG